MQLDLTRYNEKVQAWGEKTDKAMQAQGGSIGIEHRSNSPSKGASLPKLKDRYKKKEGIINRVSFNLPRNLIWTQKGAGKGRAGSVGSSWLDKYGQSKTTNPKSMGKMGTRGRSAKPFMNEVLNGPQGVEELSVIAAEELGAAIINKILI